MSGGNKRVLVTGANGYIGLAAARALRAHGYVVYGQVRSQTSSALLERYEIAPLVSSVQDAPTHVRRLGIYAIIETHKMTDDAIGVTSALVDALGADGRYLYTSGCLVYGNRPGEECLESDSVPPSRRADVENIVLKNAACGCVLRPAFVYGGDGGHFASRYWNSGDSGAVVIAGDPKKAWAWVHVDDLADAFVLALAAATDDVRGQIFNISDGTKTIFSELVSKMSSIHSKSAQLKTNVVPADTAIDQALDKSCYYKSEKAQRVLDWMPRRRPFIEDLETYHCSWRSRL